MALDERKCGMGDARIVGLDEQILVTGANGFIGFKVLQTLLAYGHTKIRCFVRPSADLTRIQQQAEQSPGATVEVLVGNLLSGEDCQRAVAGAVVILHLAAGVEKTFPGCVMNSVVTTRNLLEAVKSSGELRRFVNVSSAGVYFGSALRRGATITEECEVEPESHLRQEAYIYGKIKQDEIVRDYGLRHKIPYVIVRPGDVFGPGKRKLSGKVGLGTFGVFLHLGGPNKIPLTYLDNCAEAIVLAGITAGVDGEVFNIVDDGLPSSRRFLALYKRNVERFRSVYVPYSVFYLFCYLWERYSQWSGGQLPPVFNRRKCAAHWKPVRYSNEKIKARLHWRPKVPMGEALTRYFEYMRTGVSR